MATKSSFPTLVLLVVAATTLIQGTAAAVHFVGDTLTWTVPSNGTAAYSDWASKYNFTVGDILVFNFPVGVHDVARVTKDAFDGCNSTNPISLQTLPPANFTLNSSGDSYFICTFGQHCVLGQKLAINVSAASGSPVPTPSPSPTPSPAPTPASPTPPASPSPTPTPAPTHSPAPSPSGTTSPPSPGTPASPPSSSPPPAGSPPGTSPPPSDTNTTSPPPPSSAPPKAVAAFGIIFMSIVIGILC